LAGQPEYLQFASPGDAFVVTHYCYRDAPREIVDDLAAGSLRFETSTRGLGVPGRRCAWR